VPDEHEHSCSDEDDTNNAADDNASDCSGGETNFHILNSNRICCSSISILDKQAVRVVLVVFSQF